MDKYFKVVKIAATPYPQRVVYAAAKNDYSEKFIDKLPDITEAEAGELLEKMLWKSKTRPHLGCYEQVAITFSIGGYPHSVAMQLRTHRVGITFDVQCLAGENLVTVKRAKKGNKSKKVTLAELYQKQQSGKKLPLIRNLNEDRGYFDYVPIGEVFRNSQRNLYLVTLEDGKQLKCSMDHKIFTDKGWSRLEDLAVGDNVACNGESYVHGMRTSISETTLAARKFYSDKEWLSDQLKSKTPIEIANDLGCSYEVVKKYAYKFGLSWKIRKDHNKGKKLNLSHFTPEQIDQRRANALKSIKQAHIKVAEEGHPSRKLDDDDPNRVYNWQKYKREDILKHHGNICVNCGATENLHCHHKVEVNEDISLAYELDNYEILCSSCHAKEHKCLKVHFVKIKSIEFLRTDVTYDIEVNAKHHNFVCEGVVVHNSQRYTGKRIVKVVNGELKFEEVFYIRPVGTYQNRQGKRFYMTEEMREEKKAVILATAKHYAHYVNTFNEPEESARDVLSQAIRQNFFMSTSCRTLMHLILVRSAKDVQLECRNCIDQMMIHFANWMPATEKLTRDRFYVKGNLTP